jgi:hypothetical protein
MAKKKKTLDKKTFAEFKQDATDFELFNSEKRAVYFDGVNVWEYIHATGEKRISEVLTDYGE